MSWLSVFDIEKKSSSSRRLYVMSVPRKPQRRRLTAKQRAVMKFVTENPDATLKEIGIACGLAPSDPAIGAHNVLSSKNVQARMAELMDKRPALQDEALLVKLEEGLNAEDIQYFAFNGRVMDSRKGPAHSIRRGFLDLALKVKGALKEVREVSGPGGGPIPVAAIPIPGLADLGKNDLLSLIRATAP